MPHPGSARAARRRFPNLPGCNDFRRRMRLLARAAATRAVRHGQAWTGVPHGFARRRRAARRSTAGPAGRGRVGREKFPVPRSGDGVRALPAGANPPAVEGSARFFGGLERGLHESGALHEWDPSGGRSRRRGSAARPVGSRETGRSGRIRFPRQCVRRVGGSSQSKRIGGRRRRPCWGRFVVPSRGMRRGEQGRWWGAGADPRRRAPAGVVMRGPEESVGGVAPWA